MAGASTEHFNLAWNQFESSTAATFKNLLAEQDFADVTLACDGGQQVTAHKVILAACSPFFRKVLLANPHQHPLLYLKGVKFDDLQLIVKFIYKGQIEIGRDGLAEFLATAKELEVKGLMEANDTPVKEELGALEPQTSLVESEDEQEGDKLVVVQAPDWTDDEYYSGQGDYGHDLPDHETIKADFKSGSILQPVTPSKTPDGKFPCLECTYKATSVGNLKRHVLSRHTGERVPCLICGKDFASKDGLKVHHMNKHEGVMFRCKLCEHEATTKSNLLRHMHKKHESMTGEKEQRPSGSPSTTLPPHFQSVPVHEGPKYSAEPPYKGSQHFSNVDSSYSSGPEPANFYLE